MVATVTAVSAPSEIDRDIETAALAEVERLFREQLSPLRLFPGAALAVYHHGRLVLDLCGGYADTQRGEPVGADTLFPLFSGTKPFAAVALWQQIERGRIGLDEPVAAYWPAFAPERQGPRPGSPHPLSPGRLPHDAPDAAAGPLGRLGRGGAGRRGDAACSTSRARPAPTTF